MVILVARVLESADGFWQPLNPVFLNEEHSVVSASVTSDNCQLMLWFSPFRAAESLFQFFARMAQIMLICRCSAKRWEDSYMHELQIQLFLCLLYSCICVVCSLLWSCLFCVIHPAVGITHPYIKLSSWALSGYIHMGIVNLFKVARRNIQHQDQRKSFTAAWIPKKGHLTIHTPIQPNSA